MKYLIPFLILISPVFSIDVFAQVDYDDDIQPIFNARCTSCHGNQSGVTLTSYEATMESVGDQYERLIVVPGDPDQSPLVDKIEANPEFGSRMPQGGTLSSEQIGLIRQWIAEGANEVVTSSELLTDLPEGFKLNRNYPNPFNPTTNISFEVPEAVSYQIKVFGTHGALVEEVAGNASAGISNITLDFRNQPSGTYFYQVIAITQGQKYLMGSDKMTLVK
jgi:hypothetical protein